MLTIELGDGVRWSKCAECGRETQLVHGYVYDDGVPLAVYHAALPYGHAHDRARFLVSMGDWEAEGESAQRERATVAVQVTPEEVQMGFIDPDPGEDLVSELGRRVSRDEALASPLRTRYFDVCDLICVEDPRVRAALALSEET
jgi:hypothetical protein